ncbi:Wiskott-Aldrich syndrome protein family member 3 [Elysia marginata]|uniref:Wiskott-Aldrich syndrome protein family member 3 n=1 Tax=Elysia marginata TaxID=1093978 RepID=A0AAV4I6N0_9GAST|nr:Wiskott-Aldrich syndrome protein family member 3 [Elysia marginata]
MPLANRTVLPSCLGRRAIAEDDQTEENSLTAVSHNAVLGTIIQLASLVRHADDIFCDLAEECQAVFEKADSINLRLHALGKKIEQLDSTEVTIRKFSLVVLPGQAKCSNCSENLMEVAALCFPGSAVHGWLVCPES